MTRSVVGMMQAPWLAPHPAQIPPSLDFAPQSRIPMPPTAHASTGHGRMLFDGMPEELRASSTIIEEWLRA